MGEEGGFVNDALAEMRSTYARCPQRGSADFTQRRLSRLSSAAFHGDGV
jgi:hypothetical protein